MTPGYILYKIIKKISGKAILNTKVGKDSKIEAGSIVINSNFNKYSFCGYDCKILNTDIGAFCSIADGVKIGMAEHPITWVSTSPVFYFGRDSVKKKFCEFKREKARRTKIGNDVWIGENVLIKAGVKIGNGAVVAMGSVVTRDVEPYEIVGGIPAKHIKYRFNEEIIEKLQQSYWWKFDDEKLEKYSRFIKEPEVFLEEINK